MKIMKYFKQHNREISLIIALLAMTAIFGLMNRIYVSESNLIDILDQSTIYGMMALGMTFVIISGGIDLSVGSAFALMGVVVAKLAVSGISPVLVILITLVVGFFLGTINGILVSVVKLQPFIATLGTMSVFRGIAYVLSNGMPILGVPENYRNLVDGTVFASIRVSVFIFFVSAFIFYILLKQTKFGTIVYAIGGNEESARLSGIKVVANKILIYAVAMTGTSVAVLIQIGKLGTGEASAAQGYELNAIAAVAIGGASMAGGKGGIVGTILGAILFSGLKVGLIVSGVETFYQYIATGLVIVIAATVEIVQSKLSDRGGLKKVSS